MAIVMPADGPSFGIAPSGTCTWMSIFEWKSSARLKLRRLSTDVAERRLCRLLHDVAQLAGERQLALAGISVASLTSSSPPTSVHARPVAMPTSFCSSATLGRKRGTPRYSVTFSPLMSSLNVCPRRRPCAPPYGGIDEISRRGCGASLAGVALRSSIASSWMTMLLFVEACALDRLRREESLRDLDFFMLRVARQLQPSMRSASACGTVWSTFAVQMNITCDRSNSTSR